ncbi:ParB/RepB/Spo0J family partition protein [Psychrobacter sp. 364]|uniref:ParB/RepB/Spo0J family partition protein n=1 Tax=Psychrobacter sp. 364 TaxID=3457730 RepID=UPI004036102A
MSGLDSLSKLNISGLLDDGEVVSAITEVEINIIHEDPNNPRKVFNDKNLAELSESIAKFGVLCPISIKPHPEIENEYMINHGHRRFRAAQTAGLNLIPAFLDNNINEVGQFLENIQREDLTPLDIANWLSHAKETQGLKSNELAAMLSKSSTWVSRHLSIMDASEDIQNALKQGLITSVESAVSLSKASKDHPEAVAKFIEDSKDGDVTQKAVREFIKSLNNSDDLSADTNASNDDFESSDDNFDDDGLDDDLDSDTNVTDSSDSAPKNTTANSDNFDDDGFDDDLDSDTNVTDSSDEFDPSTASLSQGFLVEIDDVINILDSIDIDSDLSKKIADYIDDNHSTYNDNYDALRTFLNRRI